MHFPLGPLYVHFSLELPWLQHLISVLKSIYFSFSFSWFTSRSPSEIASCTPWQRWTCDANAPWSLLSGNTDTKVFNVFKLHCTTSSLAALFSHLTALYCKIPYGWSRVDPCSTPFISLLKRSNSSTTNVAPNTPLRMPNWYNFVTLYVLSLRYLTPKWLTNLTRWSKFLWFNTVMIIVDNSIHDSNDYSSLWLATWFKLGHNRSKQVLECRTSEIQQTSILSRARGQRALWCKPQGEGVRNLREFLLKLQKCQYCTNTSFSGMLLWLLSYHV